MTTTTDTRSGITHGWPDEADGWGSAANTNFARLSRLAYHLTATSVISAPPDNPTTGDTYLLATTPTGAWAAFSADNIAYYTGTAWTRYSAAQGMRCFIASTKQMLAYTTADGWEPIIADLLPICLSQAEYDALTDAKKNNGRIYLIHAVTAMP